MNEATPDLIRVEALCTYFPVRGGLFRRVQGWVKAVDGVSLTIKAGEALGVVGEPGAGKTTLAHTLLGLIPATSGTLFYRAQNIRLLSEPELHQVRSEMQLIAPHLLASFDPRMLIGHSLEEGLSARGIKDPQERQQIIRDTCRKVGLNADQLWRYPHEFSENQRQRIGIARVLALHPRFVVVDGTAEEFQATGRLPVLQLLRSLQKEFGLTCLFLAQELSSLEYITDRVAVMYQGKLVELAPTDALLQTPQHPHTQALLGEPAASAQPAHPPPAFANPLKDKIQPGAGCQFAPRCPLAAPVCRQLEPEFRPLGGNHWVACHQA
jgi:oligopeptide/dipeptide ABC transporter ATP-binding protein